ncbi:hypothetical protein CIPAW_02G015600 [Carya illinoinensis]|uniref:DNA-directed RNA polymerase III subunit RPC5 n=1 Tax=Carya illinoinensis TaxID=32201 RepID=A0A8T1RB14_CARIL|nr:hypothetical protein CIPAW_02G015600 [Carya illinoinensis]
MELDDIDAPNQVLSRTSRFAPKSKLKSKPNSQPEPRESVPKAEPREFGAAIPNKKEDAEATTAMAEAETASASVSASNGDVKMEDETLSEAKEESMEDDAMEEDAVVREIDVFFNTPMDDDTKLYVLQYPLRPSWRPYDLDDRCEEVRVKPSSDQMEVDLALDVDSKNFDQDFGNRLKLTKQTLSSSWKVPHTTGHAIGVLIGNKLHLNIIHTVVQLRPSLEHLRSGGSKRKNNVAGDGEVTVKLEESAEGRSVSPSKKQNKRIEPSTEEKTNYEEPWVPLKYHGPKSDFSARYLQRMVQQNSSPIQFTMNPHDYVDSLCPGASNNNIKPKTTSKRFMLSLPLEERIKKLLCEGPPVHRFSFLKHFALDCCDEEFLQVLQKHALLVQGLWAPKSSLLLLEDGESSLVRDYLLLLFSENSTISESDLLSNIPTNLRKKMEVFLDAFAVKRSSFKFTGWKFKEPADASFIKRYPKIVDAQKEVWNSIEKNLKKYIGGKKRGPRERNADPKPIITGTPGKTVNPTGTLMKNAIGVSSGRKTMSEETREALPKALTKVFLTHKVCRKVVIDLLRGGSPDVKLKKANVFQAAKEVLKRDISINEYNKVMNDICVSKGSAWVLKSGDGNPT